MLDVASKLPINATMTFRDTTFLFMVRSSSVKGGHGAIAPNPADERVINCGKTLPQS
jgi:hypothetical protein